MQPDALVRLIRAWLAGDPALPRVDADVLEAAAAHRMSGTLYHIRAPADEGFGAALERAWRSNHVAWLRRVAVLQRVWPRALPTPLVFKGADFAENLWNDPGARRSSDLDLLLPDPHFERAREHLERLADEARTPRSEADPGEPPYELGFRFGDVLVEMHRAIQPLHRGGLGGRAVWGRGTPGRLGDVDVRWPTPLDRVLLWLANQSKQSFHGDLADMLDLCLAVRALGRPTPWGAIARRARDTSLERALALAVRRLSGSGLWSEPLPAIGRWTDRLVATGLPPVTRPVSDANPWLFQAIKLWLTGPEHRAGVVARLGRTWLRRARR